jgi:ferredoxin
VGSERRDVGGAKTGKKTDGDGLRSGIRGDGKGPGAGVGRPEISTGEENVLARRVRITFREDFCKGCGLCVRFCPRGIISLAER